MEEGCEVVDVLYGGQRMNYVKCGDVRTGVLALFGLSFEASVSSFNFLFLLLLWLWLSGTGPTNAAVEVCSTGTVAIEVIEAEAGSTLPESVVLGFATLQKDALALERRALITNSLGRVT